MDAVQTYRLEGGCAVGSVELLSLGIGAGANGLAVAGALLERFGSLDALARAEVEELARVPGVGTALAVRLHAGLELGRRSVRRVHLQRDTIDDAEGARSVLGPRFEGLDVEELHAVYLDRRRHPLAVRRLTRGSDQYTVVDGRQIFRPAIALGAAAVVLAHNHPSGDPTPSLQDREVTRRVAEAGRVVGVAVLDHLVFGEAGYRSLAEEGMLGMGGVASSDWIR